MLDTMPDATSDSAQDITPDATPNVTPKKSTPNSKRQDCPGNDVRAENSPKKIRTGEMEDSGDVLKTPEEAQEACNNANEEDVKEEDESALDEIWSMKTVYTEREISRPDPVKCMTDGCSLLACVVWSSSLGVTWHACMDCQADEFGGWEKGYEQVRSLLSIVPGRDMQQEADAKSAKFRTADGIARPVLSVFKEPLRGKKTGGCGCHAQPKTQLERDGGEYFTFRVYIVGDRIRSKEVSPPKNPQVHRQWQEKAEKYGGKGARIVVDKDEVMKLVLDVLHFSFQPMNNNDIYTVRKYDVSYFLTSV